jgi:hypothetical protein
MRPLRILTWLMWDSGRTPTRVEDRRAAGGRTLAEGRP